MYYGYDFCQKCNDKLIERKQTKNKSSDFEKFGGKCPICGELMILTCISEEKLDSKYQILLNKSTYKKCLNNPIVIEYINRKSGMIQKKSEDLQNIIFEGDATQTYKFIEFLDLNEISYSVLSNFPIEIKVYYDTCSTCGGKLVYKEVEAKGPKELKDYVYNGMYCENCKEWEIVTSSSKLKLDETIYRLILDMDYILDDELLKVMQNLTGKENFNCKKNDVLLEDTALNIMSCGERLKAANIKFHIVPEFEYEIEPYEKVTEEFLMKILENQYKK